MVEPVGSGAVPGALDPSIRLLERLAHDLRGPLSPMQTATWLLRQGGLDTVRRDELLDILDRQADRLSEMVQEISDWVRARDGRLVARRERVPLPLLLDLATPAGELAGPVWQAAGGVAALAVDGDAQRLVQMLEALMGYLRARGGISALHAAVAEGGVELHLSGGRDWEDGEASRLFAGPDPEPHDQGLGMRLLIAREIARAHGGDVGTGEGSGAGAELRVRLPAA